MEVRIGDKVRFLNQTGEGKVVKIINNKTVMVLDEDEFEIPATITNLVVIESDFNTEGETLTSTSNSVKHKEVENKTQSNKRYIVFVPKDYSQLGTEIDAYLVNDTNDILFYTLYIEKEDGYTGIAASNCNAGEKMFIDSFTVKDFNEIKSINIHIISYKQKGEPTNPVVFKLQINPVKFFKNSSYKNNDFFDMPSMLVDIDENDSFLYKLNELTLSEEKKIISQKESTSSHGFPIIKTKDEPIEVDLHINKLLDTVVGLSNRDILQYQLDKFHEVMEENCRRKGQAVVFIHGIGNGTLKQKLNWELDHKYKSCKHQDASFQKYGPGATLVVM